MYISYIKVEPTLHSWGHHHCMYICMWLHTMCLFLMCSSCKEMLHNLLLEKSGITCWKKNNNWHLNPVKRPLSVHPLHFLIHVYMHLSFIAKHYCCVLRSVSGLIFISLLKAVSEQATMIENISSVWWTPLLIVLCQMDVYQGKDLLKTLGKFQ